MKFPFLIMPYNKLHKTIAEIADTVKENDGVIHTITFAGYISFSLATTVSTSCFVLNFENEKRTLALPGSTFNAIITCERVSLPLLHAEPLDAQMPLISRLNNSMSLLSLCGNEVFKI